MNIFGNLFHTGEVSPKQQGGKSAQAGGGDADLDRKLNWSMRSNVTVTGPTSRKPQTHAPFHDVGASQGDQDTRHHVGAPFENYYDKQFAVHSTSQWSRSFQDHTPTVQRRNDSGQVSGVANVQLINPVATTTRKRIVLYSAAGYLWAVAPRIPGQSRDNYGGFHARGIDPYSYAALIAAGPGSNPVNPGGPGKIAGRSYLNPMYSGIGGVHDTSHGGSSLCL
jgi:hypothetical protein